MVSSNDYLFWSFLALLVLVLILSLSQSRNCKCNKPEKFCTCVGSTMKQVDQETLKSEYNSGKLNEYTDFAALQKANGGPTWKRIT